MGNMSINFYRVWNKIPELRISIFYSLKVTTYKSESLSHLIACNTGSWTQQMLNN